MRKQCVPIVLVAVGLVLILGCSPSQSIEESQSDDLQKVAEALGLPSEYTEEYSLAQILEAIYARTPVRDSTGVLMIHALTLTSSFVIGQEGVLVFQTLPGATCTIEIVYVATNRPPKSLQELTKVASSKGRVEWTWNIGTQAPTKAVATVTAELDGLSVEGRFSFYVTH